MKICLIRSRWIVIALGSAGLSLWSASAQATSHCGSTSAGWNAPLGAAVFNSSSGPIQAVIGAIGEYRTHSMLSHGPDGWVTHATSDNPALNTGNLSPFGDGICNAPLDPNFLTASTPGLETISQGAIYQFLYGDPGLNFIAYQQAMTTPDSVGLGNDWLGTGMSWMTSTSVDDPNQTIFGLAYNGTKIHYGWYQYMNLQGAAQGVPGVDTGLVCSTSLSLWQHDALSSTPGYTGDILPRYYAPSVAQPAAQALYNATYNQCESQTGMFSSLTSFAETIGSCVLCLDCNLCDEAADQMTNCFTGNDCASSDDSEWQSIVSSTGSSTISPDDVGCWNGNGTGAPCFNAGSSVWGWDDSEDLQWNSGGNDYSCWD